MVETTIDKVKLTDKMQRTLAKWNDREVTCIFFISPKNTYCNEPATAIMQKPIMGNAIVVGVSIAEVQSARNDKTWATLASRLPKNVPLDELALERLRVESKQNTDTWADYFRRKKQRNSPVEADEPVAQWNEWAETFEIEKE